MLDRVLRIVKEKALAPFALFLVNNLNATPNALTTAGLLVVLVCGLASSQGYRKVAFFLWGCNRLLDGVDGVMARLTNQSSDFGGFWDIACDFVGYALLPISAALSFEYSLSLWVTVAVLQGTYFVNAGTLFQLSAILEKRNAGAAASNEMTTVTMPVSLVEG